MGYLIAPWSGTLVLHAKCHFCAKTSKTKVQVWFGKPLGLPLPPDCDKWFQLLFHGEVVWSCGGHIVKTKVDGMDAA